MGGGGEEHTYMKEDIHVIGSFYTTRQCTGVHHLRVQNKQTWGKGCVLGHCLQYDEQFKIEHEQMHSVYPLGKIYV